MSVATPEFRIPFVRPTQTGTEAAAVLAAIGRRYLSGDREASRSAEAYLREAVGAGCAMLTPSGTAALELAAILCDLREGDEVIMPSYTFASTANAVVLRGAVPVFVDVRADTLNLDETLIEQALTPRTRAIFVVHYAGVPCAMEPINAIARAHGLTVVEDAAQALHSAYRGQPAGGLGDMAAFSFHETKNIHCGEGGAFVCRSPEIGRRAEIVREKGTNRTAFFRGEIDRYTWMDVGSSFLPSELNAAFLLAQMEASREITARRLEAWTRYAEGLGEVAAANDVLVPAIPEDCVHNGHIYHLRMGSAEARARLMARLAGQGIQAISHYVPLHASPAGRKHGRQASGMANTERAAGCLVRLPLWSDLTAVEADEVIGAVREALA